MNLSRDCPVNRCSFNGPEDLFAAATKQGFNIYRTDPFALTTQRAIPGGLLIAELLESSNLMAIIPTGSPNTVHIWDDREQAVVAQLRFEHISPLRAVRIRRDVLVCVLQNQVRVYLLCSNLSLVHEYQTIDNPKGLIALSGDSQACFAIPARKVGWIQLINLGSLDTSTSTWSAKPKHLIISAHSAQLNCLAMNKEGTLVATSSTTGTLIRVWRTSNGQQLSELRRGIDQAAIHSMSFSGASQTLPRLAVISDKETAHIYNLPVDGNENMIGNKLSSFSRLADLGIASHYFGSVWSAYRATIPQVTPQISGVPITARRFLIAWTSDRVFVVLGSDGGYWKFFVPEKPKTKLGETTECSQESYRMWMKQV